MSFTDFLKEKEEEMMNQETEDTKAKIVAIFTEGEPVTVETITAKAEEFEMDKEELENQVYEILFDMLNVEDETDLEPDAEEDLEADGESEMDFTDDEEDM